MIVLRGKPALLLLFYAFAILFALGMAQWASATGYKAVEGGDKPETATNFFFLILIATGIFLALATYFRWLLKLLAFLFELFFLFFTSTLFFSVHTGFGVVWGLFLLLARLLLPNNVYLRNLSASIISGVAAGLLGPSLAIPVALLLYVLLLIYDFVAVFLTGHMVKLAKSLEKVEEGRGEGAILGGGDLVMPLLFAFSLPFPYSLLSSLYALLGLAATMGFLRLFKRPLPALPYIGAIQLSLTALTLYLSTLLP